MMIAVNIHDPSTAEDFVSEIVGQFKLRRTLAPPDTTSLLVTIIGDLSADRFADRWHELTRDDLAASAYLAMMKLADVVQITKAGEPLSKATLLLRPGFTSP